MRGLTDWEYCCLNSDWIKDAGWNRTFSDEEHRLLKMFKGCAGAMCAWGWLLRERCSLR